MAVRFIQRRRITVVKRWNTILKVDETGQVVDAVLSGFSRIIDTNEGDSLLVAVIVNVLQFG